MSHDEPSFTDADDDLPETDTGAGSAIVYYRIV